MKRFFSKPIAVEATQITDSDFDGPHPNENHVPGVKYLPRERHVVIETFPYCGFIGDWIVRLPNGDLLIQDHETFVRMYRPENDEHRIDFDTLYPEYCDAFDKTQMVNQETCAKVLESKGPVDMARAAFGLGYLMSRGYTPDEIAISSKAEIERSKNRVEGVSYSR